jgi:hypothetical protein
LRGITKLIGGNPEQVGASNRDSRHGFSLLAGRVELQGGAAQKGLAGG